MTVGFISSVLFGAGMPGFSVFFGGMIDGMGEQSADDASSLLKEQALMMVYFGLGVWIFSWLQVTCWT